MGLMKKRETWMLGLALVGLVLLSHWSVKRVECAATPADVSDYAEELDSSDGVYLSRNPYSPPTRAHNKHRHTKHHNDDD
ncbi:hypothetical protein ACLOJK_008131 [Asimina triloba]